MSGKHRRRFHGISMASVIQFPRTWASCGSPSSAAWSYRSLRQEVDVHASLEQPFLLDSGDVPVFFHNKNQFRRVFCCHPAVKGNVSELVPCRRHAQRGLLVDAFPYAEGGSTSIMVYRLMLCSFTKQVLAQLDLLRYCRRVWMAPCGSHCDRRV